MHILFVLSVSCSTVRYWSIFNILSLKIKSPDRSTNLKRIDTLYLVKNYCHSLKFWIQHPQGTDVHVLTVAFDDVFTLSRLSFYGQLLDQLNVASLYSPTAFLQCYSLLLGQINDDDDDYDYEGIFHKMRFTRVSVPQPFREEELFATILTANGTSCTDLCTVSVPYCCIKSNKQGLHECHNHSDHEVHSLNTKSVFQWKSPDRFRTYFKFFYCQGRSGGTIGCLWRNLLVPRNRGWKSLTLIEVCISAVSHSLQYLRWWK